MPEIQDDNLSNSPSSVDPIDQVNQDQETEVKQDVVSTEDDVLAKSGELVAQSILASNSATDPTGDSDNDNFDDVKMSNKIGETILSLQNLIEKYARQLQELNKQLAEKKDSYRNFFNNDVELNEAQEKAKELTKFIKKRKAELRSHPQIVELSSEIKQLNEEKKELEQSLSNYLVTYHALTNSNSFDTSEGDQWEFEIKAKIKPKRSK